MRLETLTSENYDVVEASCWKGGVPDPITASAQPAKVLVSRGVWIAECPEVRLERKWPDRVAREAGIDNPYVERSCGFAMVLCRGKQLRCPHHNHLYRVVVPPDWEAIEEALLKRPLPNRNMDAGETLADLLRENEEHGLD